uniref:ATP-grasp domain-containing protein n=1 Tax=uncultured Alphaproteobacteria bacterium TaxID=91750 RepID=A0A6G8F370_9PROT|nr:hypothetical protein PlAlph_5950 [uncultured Alphaproteobacteria bacterium]
MFAPLCTETKEIFENAVKTLSEKGTLFVMPAFYPQRGGILQEVVSLGGKAVIAGGAPQQQLFDGITQYSPGYDTTGISETAKEIYKIVRAIPDEAVRGKDVALFVEAPVARHWSNNMRIKKANIVSSNEQNLRSFFEEKTNLEKILKTAGLEDCFIPSEVVVSEKLTSKDMAQLYEKYKGATGKVVLQSCGAENVESGGGKGTSIVSNSEEFCQTIVQHTGHVKVASFIEGCCSNVSMFVGNRLPDKDGTGVVKGELLPQDNAFAPETLDILLQRGAELGIQDKDILVLATRGTLKAVGDKNLTKSSSNGVGNALGHNFSDDINDKIFEISQKLGMLMGKCGKVGLCGADLMIDQNNHVWINEVNDRQQGPTEQLSLDAESAGLVGIHRLAFIANYADCSHPRVQKLFYQLQQVSGKMYAQSLQSDGSFYIKMMGKQAGNATAQIDLEPGIYAVRKQKDGSWKWDFSKKYATAPNIDLKNDEIYLKLSGVSLHKGQTVPSGAQILRIVGKAKNGSSPFQMNGAKVSLNEKWRPITDSLYASMFGAQYNRQFTLAAIRQGSSRE